jgi:molecular chaperone GrpE
MTQTNHKAKPTEPSQPQAKNPTDQQLVERLEQELVEAKQGQEEMLKQSQRALADYANLKKRFDKERLELAQYAAESVAVQLLGSLDNLERAITYASPQEQSGGLYQGVKMTLQQIDATLSQIGLSRMVLQPGATFDPHQHEAIDTVKGPKDQVVEVTESGYTLHDKVIRPAKVKVGNGEDN